MSWCKVGGGAIWQGTRESFNGLPLLLPWQSHHYQFPALLNTATQTATKKTRVSFKKWAPFLQGGPPRAARTPHCLLRLWCDGECMCMGGSLLTIETPPMQIMKYCYE